MKIYKIYPFTVFLISVSAGFSVCKSYRLERSLLETPVYEKVSAHIGVSCPRAKLHYEDPDETQLVFQRGFPFANLII